MLVRKTFALVMLCVIFFSSSNSFPTVTAVTRSRVKYLVAFFDFEDLAHTKSIDELKGVAVDQVLSFYDQVSYGKLKISGDIIPKWITLPAKVKDLNVFVWNYNQDDMFMIDTLARQALFTQPGMGATAYDVKFVVYAGKVWGHARPYYGMTYMNEFYKTGVFRHELGHALGLPDLYSYRLETEGKPGGVWVGPWDLMSWSGRGGFSSWSLIKLGWIDNKQIQRVGDKVEGTFLIDALGNKTGMLYVLQVHIPRTTQDYYVEVRENVGADADLYKDWYPDLKLGVVMYLVSSTGEPEEGKIRVIDSHLNSDKDPELDLLDASFNIGNGENPALINKPADLSIIVLEKGQSSYRLLLGTAALGEQAQEANSAIGKAEEAVRKAETQTRTNGLQTSKDTLQSAKMAYGQARFADATALALQAATQADVATRPTSTTSAVTSTSASSQGTPLSGVPESATALVYVIPIAVVIILIAAMIHLRRRKHQPTK